MKMWWDNLKSSKNRKRMSCIIKLKTYNKFMLRKLTKLLLHSKIKRIVISILANFCSEKKKNWREDSENFPILLKNLKTKWAHWQMRSITYRIKWETTKIVFRQKIRWFNSCKKKFKNLKIRYKQIKWLLQAQKRISKIKITKNM
jgi:hypothetical protein